MNKKGFFMMSLFIFSVLAVSIAIYASTKMADSVSETLSGAQFSLINNSNSVYEELYFRNELLKLVVNESVFELGRQGGSLGGDLTDNYRVWYRNEKTCWPTKENLIKNYISVLESKMDFYWQDDYDFELTEELDNFKISGGDILRESEGDNYRIVSLSADKPVYVLDYNFEDFLTKADNIKNILSKCKDNSECWGEERDKFGSWFKVLNIDGKVYKFELSSAPFGGKEVIIRGAVDFSNGDLKC